MNESDFSESEQQIPTIPTHNRALAHSIQPNLRRALARSLACHNNRIEILI